MKVAILSTFYDVKPSYSLTTVVLNQFQAFIKNGYESVFFVLPSFYEDEEVPAGVEIRKVVPQIILEPYGEVNINKVSEEQVSKDVTAVVDALVANMQDIDVAITHDWMLVNTYSPYAAALHIIEENKLLPKTKFLHWIHSAPSPFTSAPYPWSEQYRLPAGHKLVYLNHTDKMMAVERYQATVDDVRVVHNAIDPRTYFGFHETTSSLIDKYDLLSADIMQTYPISSTRMWDKQVHKVIKLFGKFKELGKSVRLVVCNAHANGEREKEAIKEMMKLAESFGLTDREVIFTSTFSKELEHGVPHDVVRDMFLISNIFFFPTVSENCPLILLEAAGARNLLILNEDFPPLKEFFAEDALYFKFSSLRQNTEYKDEEKYFLEVAKIVLAELGKNTALKSFNTWKKSFNFDYLFKTELEPLLFEGKKPDGL